MFKLFTTGVTFILAIILSSCSGSDTPPTQQSTFTLSGTVPGTVIEAYGDNGSYYKTTSIHNGSGMHPFELELKAGVNYALFMTVNEGTSESITTPIYFSTASTPTAAFSAEINQNINLGHLTLDTNRSTAIDDKDKDGIIDDGYYYEVYNAEAITSYSAGTHTWDIDGDGKHNHYDDDYVRGIQTNDSDDDGIDDSIDINPHNLAGANSFAKSYYDRDDDGYFDYDHDRNGELDDAYDYDHDGDYDDEDYNHQYGNNGYAEVEGKITAINDTQLTVYSYEIEGFTTTNIEISIDVTNAYFERTSLANLAVGMFIEAKGSFNSATNTLNAYKVERDL